jgi:hypothetical protein
MTDDLASAFGITAVDVGGLSGSFFYTYSVFALVSSAALDRFGARAAVPIGAAVMAIGALLFVADGLGGAQIGRRRLDWRSRSELHGAPECSGPGRARWSFPSCSAVGVCPGKRCGSWGMRHSRDRHLRAANSSTPRGDARQSRRRGRPRRGNPALSDPARQPTELAPRSLRRLPVHTNHDRRTDLARAILHQGARHHLPAGSAQRLNGATGSGGSDLTASAFRHVGLLGSSRC